MHAQLRDRLQHQDGPAVQVLRNFYKQHELADAGQMLSRYIWFGLVSGRRPSSSRFCGAMSCRRKSSRRGLSEILSNYYKEQKIGELWRQGAQPVYTQEIEQMHDSVAQVVLWPPWICAEILDPPVRVLSPSLWSRWLAASPTCGILAITMRWW
jgi:hypothetical protein